MSNSALEVISVKNCIPEFIIKVYTILEKNEFEDIICWSQNNNEILIKDQKKLEKQVLPIYFRHNKIESFIRQLNMYRFSKVTKMDKEKNHLYFKNEHFKRGCIESLVFIKRKKKGGSGTVSSSEDQASSTGFEAQNVEMYKDFVKANILTIQDELQRIKKQYPLVSSELTKVFQISNMLIGRDMNHQVSATDEQFPTLDNHMFQSIKDLLPQQQETQRFFRLGSACSIGNEVADDI